MADTVTRRQPLPLADTTCTPVPGGDLPPAEAERIALLLKAIADPVRLRLLTRLATSEDEVCVCDFPDVGVSQPTVSHHLKKLRDAGLVECERRGTWVYYRHKPEQLDRVRAFLAELAGPVVAIAGR